MLRNESGMTQEQLAQLLNVTRSTIAGYETKCKEPDFHRLIQIASIFHVTTDYLLGYDKWVEHTGFTSYICLRCQGQTRMTPVPEAYVNRLHQLLMAGLPELFTTKKEAKKS
jgi:transcriptional regulator with XRE-family HTH domain